MVKRGRKITVTLAAVVVVLFAGRRLSVILSDYWFGSLVSSDAAQFLIQFHLLRAVLDGAGVLVAGTWFIGNLFVIYRALGSVQIPRNLGNFEFREALTPNILRLIAITTGGAIGLMIGLGASEWWPTLALSWHGVVFGVADPLLGHDLGLYLAQLPWWRTLHSFVTLLLVVALLLVTALYWLIGSLRITERRLAISNHARGHIGALLAGLALAMAWGYLLQPYEIVAGLHGHESAGSWAIRSVSFLALSGTALATAALSLVWALRPRHTLVLATWIVMVAASITVQAILPNLAADDRSAFSVDDLTNLEREAFALESLRADHLAAAISDDRYAPFVEPWSRALVRRLVEIDSTRVLGLAATPLVTGGARRSVWLSVFLTGGRIGVAAVAADRTTSAGGAMSYSIGDSMAYPSVLSLAEIDTADTEAWPGAPAYRIGQGSGGLKLDSWLRRATLAWGLQAPNLLREQPPGSSLTWNRDPVVRASRLAPFADWRDPQPAWYHDRLWWLITGYLSAETFPGAEAVLWSGRPVRFVRPGFVAAIDAVSGETHLYLLPEAGAVASSWAALAGPVIEPAGAIPAGLLRSYRYQPSMAEIQVQAIGRPPWDVGVLVQQVGSGIAADRELELRWVGDERPGFSAAYHRAPSRMVSALLAGYLVDGIPQLRLTVVDSAAGIATPAVLQQLWARFPLFEQLRDSIRQQGTELESGPVRYSLVRGGLAAYAPHYAVRRGARPVTAWYSLAAGDRLGAGRTLQESRQNLLGLDVPSPPGRGPASTLDEARRWMRLADSAILTGDWEAFGRAFGALRALLGEGED